MNVGARPPFLIGSKEKTGTNLIYKMTAKDPRTILHGFCSKKILTYKMHLKLDHIWGQQAHSLRKKAVSYNQKTTVTDFFLSMSKSLFAFVS